LVGLNGGVDLVGGYCGVVFSVALGFDDFDESVEAFGVFFF